VSRLFGKRKGSIQGDLSTYNQKVLACMDLLEEMFGTCLEGADRDRLREFYTRIHTAEGEADDIRREIEVSMYTRSLFPESRGDILGLLEAMDRVPNHAESTVRMVLNQHMDIPGEYCDDLSELAGATVKCVRAMVEGVEQLFSNFVAATATVGKIDQLESEADRLEEALIDSIFGGKSKDLTKMQLKDLVEHLGGISDRAEGVADRIRIIVAKRGV
jgi:predicted phosphate transport protein (TIGR00153 family)